MSQLIKRNDRLGLDKGTDFLVYRVVPGRRYSQVGCRARHALGVAPLVVSEGSREGATARLLHPDDRETIRDVKNVKEPQRIEMCLFVFLGTKYLSRKPRMYIRSRDPKRKRDQHDRSRKRRRDATCAEGVKQSQ